MAWEELFRFCAIPIAILFSIWATYAGTLILDQFYIAYRTLPLFNGMKAKDFEEYEEARNRRGTPDLEAQVEGSRHAFEIPRDAGDEAHNSPTPQAVFDEVIAAATEPISLEEELRVEREFNAESSATLRKPRIKKPPLSAKSLDKTHDSPNPEAAFDEVIAAATEPISLEEELRVEREFYAESSATLRKPRIKKPPLSAKSLGKTPTRWNY